jgi:hypothetical protein
MRSGFPMWVARALLERSCGLVCALRDIVRDRVAQAAPADVRRPDLAADTMAFQTYLEGVRAHPDDEELAEDLARARRRMEITWLERA